MKARRKYGLLVQYGKWLSWEGMPYMQSSRLPLSVAECLSQVPRRPPKKKKLGRMSRLKLVTYWKVVTQEEKANAY